MRRNDLSPTQLDVLYRIATGEEYLTPPDYFRKTRGQLKRKGLIRYTNQEGWVLTEDGLNIGTRTMGRVLAVEGEDTWCDIPLYGAGVAILPTSMLGGKAKPGFRFFMRVLCDELPEQVRHEGYEDLGVFGLELDHDQRVPSYEELLTSGVQV